jgi:hypothetical protein
MNLKTHHLWRGRRTKREIPDRGTGDRGQCCERRKAQPQWTRSDRGLDLRDDRWSLKDSIECQPHIADRVQPLARVFPQAQLDDTTKTWRSRSR